MRQRTMSNAIEALEYPFHILGRNSHALVLHAQHNVLFVRRFQLNPHVYLVSGVFHGIVEHIGNRGTQIFGVASHSQSVAVTRCLLVTEGLGLQVMSQARGIHAFAH